jgi:hypothetical protein
MPETNLTAQLRGRVTFLDNAIAQQRRAVKFYVCYACAMIVVGLFVIIIAFALGDTFKGETFKWFLSLGGAFVSSLSGFPIKLVLDRYERITGLGFLRNEFESSEDKGPPASVDLPRYTFAQQYLEQYLKTTLEAGK